MTDLSLSLQQTQIRKMWNVLNKLPVREKGPGVGEYRKLVWEVLLGGVGWCILMVVFTPTEQQYKTDRCGDKWDMIIFQWDTIQ